MDGEPFPEGGANHLVISAPNGMTPDFFNKPHEGESGSVPSCTDVTSPPTSGSLPLKRWAPSHSLAPSTTSLARQPHVRHLEGLLTVQPDSELSP